MVALREKRRRVLFAVQDQEKNKNTQTNKSTLFTCIINSSAFQGAEGQTILKFMCDSS